MTNADDAEDFPEFDIEEQLAEAEQELLSDELKQATPSKAEGETYSKEEIEELKLLGLPKPDTVTWGDWIGPKDASHRHELLVHFAASGLTNRQIARELGMTESRISIILQSSMIKDLIRKKQEEYFGSQTRKRLESLATKAIDTFDDVLSSKQEKSSLRVDVAKYITDQAVGKAKQDIKVEGSLLAELLHRLDSRSDSPTPSLPKDSIDSMADDIIDVPYVVGERGTTDEEES